jgi:hypothetical protein
VPRVLHTSALLQRENDSRKKLVDRIAQSRYISKSARLNDLLIYLCDRVIDEGVEEIHEKEVGHRVFGRAKDYDTASDNIVRVHASTLRKRLDQFFADDGRDEPIVIELPKGNYAPVFRERVQPELVADLPPVTQALELPVAAENHDLRLWLAWGVALLFACSTLMLVWRMETSAGTRRSATSLPPAVREFWSSVFRPNEKSDIVLDDAALGLYQELDGRPIALSEYFDRSYLRRLGEKRNANSLDPDLAGTLVLKRQSSYASAHLLWQLSRTAAALGSDGAVQFARDYGFRQLKSNRAILLGNSRSNPWMEPFESRLGIRWTYDQAAGLYYPVDTLATPGKEAQYKASGEHPDGYCSIALLPNMGGTGSVIILSGTGGAAAGSAGMFLLDGERMAELRARVPGGKRGDFPFFEALLRIPSRSRLPKDAQIVICRPPRS